MPGLGPNQCKFLMPLGDARGDQNHLVLIITSDIPASLRKYKRDR